MTTICIICFLEESECECVRRAARSRALQKEGWEEDGGRISGKRAYRIIDSLFKKGLTE